VMFWARMGLLGQESELVDPGRADIVDYGLIESVE